MRIALAILLAGVAACGGGDDSQNLCADDVVDPVDGDGCCTVGANANTDSDCVPECGNDVTEQGESCDDGNTESGDGCDSACVAEVTPTAFRISQMTLADPHPFAAGVLDVTDTVNDLIRDSIEMDASMPADGLLDFSVVPVFRPLDQTAAASVPMDIVFADCTDPLANTSCTRTADSDVVSATAMNDDCLAPIAGTTGGYSPAVVTPGAPCFGSNAVTFDVGLGDINLHLEDARISATYSGDPATSLTSGLIFGFVSEEQADATILPEDILVVGGMPLSSILKDEDKDTGPGNAPGWWFYLNFTAQPVGYTE
jgi:cysteine-rich repeat protein